jgi:steroid delta-isomerase-like uncharacterized protein
VSVEEQNKALVRRWFDEVMGQGKIDTLDAICAECSPNFIVIKGALDPAPTGMEGLRQLVRGFREAYPDMKFTIEDQIAEGDKVVTRVTVRGTHQGEVFGIPPTGKPFEISGTSIWEVKHGLLIQEWVNWDSLGLLRQLGVMEAPREAVTA